MTYFALFIIFLAGVVLGVIIFIFQKEPIRRNQGLFVFCIISLILGIYLSLDLPSFLTGRQKAEVDFIDVDSGRKSLVSVLVDSSHNIYWSGGINYNWAYDKEHSDFRNISTIRYLPHTKFVMKITEGRKEIYNQWEDFGTLIFAIIIAIFISLFKGIFK